MLKMRKSELCDGGELEGEDVVRGGRSIGCVGAEAA